MWSRAPPAVASPASARGASSLRCVVRGWVLKPAHAEGAGLYTSLVNARWRFLHIQQRVNDGAVSVCYDIDAQRTRFKVALPWCAPAALHAQFTAAVDGAGPCPLDEQPASAFGEEDMTVVPTSACPFTIRGRDSEGAEVCYTFAAQDAAQAACIAAACTGAGVPVSYARDAPAALRPASTAHPATTRNDVLSIEMSTRGGSEAEGAAEDWRASRVAAPSVSQGMRLQVADRRKGCCSCGTARLHSRRTSSRGRAARGSGCCGALCTRCKGCCTTTAFLMRLLMGLLTYGLQVYTIGANAAFLVRTRGLCNDLTASDSVRTAACNASYVTIASLVTIVLVYVMLILAGCCSVDGALGAIRQRVPVWSLLWFVWDPATAAEKDEGPSAAVMTKVDMTLCLTRDVPMTIMQSLLHVALQGLDPVILASLGGSGLSTLMTIQRWVSLGMREGREAQYYGEGAAGSTSW